MKGQSSVEFLFWICAAMLMFAASLFAFGKGFAQLGPSSANMEMQEFLTTVFSSADSLGEHGTRIARILIPQGISGFSSEEQEGGWSVAFQYGNTTYNRTAPYRLVVSPENLLYAPGAHVIKISRSGGVVFVEEMQGDG